MKSNLKKLLAGTLAAAVCVLSGCTSNLDNREDPLAAHNVDALLPFETRDPDAAATATPSAAPDSTSIVNIPQNWQNEAAPEGDNSTDVPTKAPTATPAPTATRTVYTYIRLEQGDEGEEVMRLQSRLIELGYLSGSADGKFGANTKSAVKRFQKALGLSQTGVATVSLQEKLFISSAPTYSSAATVTNPPVGESDSSGYEALVRGDRGEAVMTLQKRLIELGYLSGTADGVFGANTENAVKAFQAQLGLSQTGVASSAVQGYLFASDAPRAPAQATARPTAAPTQIPTQAPQASGAYAQLEPGDTGEAVVRMQNRLKELGYFTANSTGNYYKETTAAVQRFQAAVGQSQTGIATSATLTRLYASDAPAYSGTTAEPTNAGGGYTTLRSGSKGTEVLNLQKRLISLGYMTTSADGDFGARTEAAVKLFQQAIGYEQNGVASVGLQNLLFSDSAPVYVPAATSMPTAVPTAAPTQVPAQQTYAQLEPGNTGDAVKQLQSRLKELGFFSGLIGGNYLTKTTDAVKLFQAAIGHSQTGVATSEMQAILFSDSAPTYESVESDYVDLEKMDSGIQVLYMQQRLIDLGYLSGAADGDYGSKTEAAVKAFQTQAGLPATGKATAETQEVLYSSNAPYAPAATQAPTQVPVQTTQQPSQQQGSYPELSRGSTGEAVKNIQRRLKELGYFDGDIGGNYLTKTETAVKLFQAAIGYTADGVATSSMQSLLFSESAPAYTGSGYITLSNGMTGPAVVRLQQRLKELGYLSGSADGDFGGGTEKAVKLFQKVISFHTQDGSATAELQELLFASDAPVYVGEETDMSGYRTLSYGNSGEDVKAIQRRLKELGYFDGDIGGNYLTKTEAAVKLFQQTIGVTADGVATSAIQERILSSSAPAYGSGSAEAPVNPAKPEQLTVLIRGDSGSQVKTLQQRLIYLGWLLGEADGDFGSATEEALFAFQYRMGLETDGVAGIEVQELLYDETAPAYVEYYELLPGSEGEEVLAIQMRLIELGYLENNAYNTDGIYGAGLQNALIQLQLMSGVEPELANGIATVELQTFLFSENATLFAILPEMN